MAASLDGKVIVVTGASSGIGEAAAKALSALGAKLVLAARRKDRLVALSESLPGDSIIQQTDVTQRGDVDALAAAAVERFGRIDALVNNAGVMPLSFLAAGRVEEWDRMVDVNIKGVLYGINAVLPGMLERGSGDIVNVASVAGHVVMPSSAVYSGTKFAVRAISEGLRKEAAGKVRVTIVSPGAVATELTDSIGDETVRARMAETFKDLTPMPADAIADAIVYALTQAPGVSVGEIVIRPTGQAL